MPEMTSPLLPEVPPQDPAVSACLGMAVPPTVCSVLGSRWRRWPLCLSALALVGSLALLLPLPVSPVLRPPLVLPVLPPLLQEGPVPQSLPLELEALQPEQHALHRLTPSDVPTVCQQLGRIGRPSTFVPPGASELSEHGLAPVG